MNERERVLTLLSGGKPDQVPWLGDLSYWLPSALKQGKLDSKYAGDGIFQLHRDLGVGFYLQGYFPFRPVMEGVESRRSDSGGEHLEELITPVGTLREVSRYLPTSYTSAICEHLIKTPEDLKIFMYVCEHTRYEPDYDIAAYRVSAVGDNGVVLCYQPRSPLMELIAARAGIMTVVELMGEAPELLDELIELMVEKYDQASQLTLESPAECIMLPENISSEVVGKRFFEKYMRAIHEKWYGRIAAAGKTSFVHLDGTMRGLIGELSAAGARVIEALTTGPVGDIEIEDLHNCVGDQTIMWGGLPGIYLTDLISDAEFDAYVVRVLETMRKTPRYVLGVADQVPPGCRPERVARVRTLVDAHGKYQ